ncbi:GpE family phage tail protein [Asticcacaulis sp. YBE204]
MAATFHFAEAELMRFTLKKLLHWHKQYIRRVKRGH